MAKNASRSRTRTAASATDMENTEATQIEQTGKFNLTCSKFVPRTPAQKRLLTMLRNRDKFYVFATGPAGTGKTYCEVRYALEALADGAIKRIYITRPAIEVEGEQLGFLPGELADKFEPYLAPIIEVAKDCMRPGTLKYLREHGRITAVPIGFLRGRTLSDCVVIVDEAQNTTPEQMKMLVTRIGEGGKMVLNGDLSQKDRGGISGLSDVLHRMGHLPIVGQVKFTKEDSVRTSFMADVLACYED